MIGESFYLPLQPDAFASALHKGQGRALLHVRQYGSEGLDPAICDAVLNIRSYDPQCEGDRTQWLLELIDSTPSPGRLREAIAPRLSEPTDCFWSATQRSGIARRWAEQGDERARASLYAALQRWQRSGDVIAAHDIVLLDGSDGLIHVAEFMGRIADEDPQFWSVDAPLEWYDETHGNGAGRRLLESVAGGAPRVASFLRRWNERQANNVNYGCRNLDNLPRAFTPSKWMQEIGALSANEVILRIAAESQQQRGAWCTTWGRSASETDRAVVFQALLQEQDPTRLCKYLRVFGRARLAEFDERLLRFAEHANLEVRRCAHRALANYRHPDVRRLAIAELSKARVDEDQLLLLTHNYQAGDDGIISGVLVDTSDCQVLHSRIYDLLAVFKANRLPECRESMLFVYEASPCSLCRHSAVKLLLELALAPRWLVEECRDDASPEVRELVAGVE